MLVCLFVFACLSAGLSLPYIVDYFLIYLHCVSIVFLSISYVLISFFSCIFSLVFFFFHWHFSSYFIPSLIPFWVWVNFSFVFGSHLHLYQSKTLFFIYLFIHPILRLVLFSFRYSYFIPLFLVWLFFFIFYLSLFVVPFFFLLFINAFFSLPYILFSFFFSFILSLIRFCIFSFLLSFSFSHNTSLRQQLIIMLLLY